MVICIVCIHWCALNMLFSFFYRDNGVKAIENLMTKKGKFDYVLLETTGLADPGIVIVITFSSLSNIILSLVFDQNCVTRI